MADKITIMKEGRERTAEIITTFRIPEYDKEYVLYTFGEKQKDNIKILASTLKKDEEGYSLEKIATDEEWETIKTIIKDLSQKES